MLSVFQTLFDYLSQTVNSWNCVLRAISEWDNPLMPFFFIFTFICCFVAVLHIVIELL